MPNEYSIAVHKYISSQIEFHQQENGAAEARGDKAGAAYSQGQLQELQWLRDYLAETIDLKNFTYY